MSERKPKLEWERVEVDGGEWRVIVGDMFALFVNKATDDEEASWNVYSGVQVQCEAGSAQGIEAAKLAAEDYAFAELVKAVASFGMTIVEPSK